VQSLVKLHGGSVEAHSDGPGTGSVFTIRLPLEDSAWRLALGASPNECDTPGTQSESSRYARHHEPGAKRQVPSAPSEAMRILVVDDNQDAADSLAELLRLLGADARATYDGAAALQMIETLQPAIVLLDIGMPGMDGYEVARWVRQHPEHAKVVLIALTGWGQEHDRQHSRAAGINHHLIKPVEFETLRTLLESLEGWKIEGA
jgi:CheY-like chemotaxis protein